MDTKQLWSGKFGDDYTARNRVDWVARSPFWRDMSRRTDARSVFEFGCNAGWNLSAIRRMFPDVACRGQDINTYAIWQAQNAGLEVFDASIITFGRGRAELVFTAGVLIHIPPDDIVWTMTKLRDASYGYVLAVEYESDAETEIEYRGITKALWKRPYGKMYESLGLKCVATGPANGFDDCTYWLMRK